MKQIIHQAVRKMKPSRHLKIQKNKYDMWGAVFLIIITAVYFTPLKSEFNTYSMLGGIFWITAVMIMVKIAPGVEIRARHDVKETAVMYSVTGAVICLAVLFMVGIFLDYIQTSPYDHTIMGMFLNIIRVLPALIFREKTREYILFLLQRKRRSGMFYIAIVTVFFAATEINLAKIPTLSGAEQWVAFLAKDVLVIMSEHVLLTYLCLSGGWKASLYYTGIIKLFYIIFPIIPSLPWIGEVALKVTITLAIIMLSFGRLSGRKSREAGSDDKGIFFNLIAVAATVLLCWFSVGMFPVFPSIVLTGSMEPEIMPGDIVLVDKASDEKDIYDLQVGDVLNFKRGDIVITHRIIEIIEDEAGNVSFRTKGDNNDSPDVEIVKPQDVKGRVIKTIPKVGSPIVLMYSYRDVPEGVVD